MQSGKTGAKPNKVLGKKTTSELAKQGPDGRAAAELAAETSAAVGEESTGPGKPSNAGKGKKNKHKEASKSHAGKEKGAAAGSGGGPSGPSSGAGSTGATSGGSSALGQIAAQATGTSSGQLGLLMPLALILGLLFCGAYLARNRRLAS